MAKKKAKKQMSGGKKAGIGIGLTTAAVSAAGAYFLYGSKNAASNRQKVKGWSLKAKGEILEALEKTEEITAEEYKELVESAVGVYATVSNVSSKEISEFKREMAIHWDNLQKSKAVKKIKKPKKLVKKATKKAAKKTTKKPVKKVAKKTPKKKAVKKTVKKSAKKTTKKTAKKKK